MYFGLSLAWLSGETEALSIKYRIKWQKRGTNCKLYFINIKKQARRPWKKTIVILTQTGLSGLNKIETERTINSNYILKYLWDLKSDTHNNKFDLSGSSCLSGLSRDYMKRFLWIGILRRTRKANIRTWVGCRQINILCFVTLNRQWKSSIFVRLRANKNKLTFNRSK